MKAILSSIELRIVLLVTLTALATMAAIDGVVWLFVMDAACAIINAVAIQRMLHSERALFAKAGAHFMVRDVKSRLMNDAVVAMLHDTAEIISAKDFTGADREEAVAILRDTAEEARRLRAEREAA